MCVLGYISWSFTLKTSVTGEDEMKRKLKMLLRWWEIKTSALHMEMAIDLFDFLPLLKPWPFPSPFQKSFIFSEITRSASLDERL